MAQCDWQKSIKVQDLSGFDQNLGFFFFCFFNLFFSLKIKNKNNKKLGYVIRLD